MSRISYLTSVMALSVALTGLTTAARAQDVPSMQNLSRDDAIYAAIPEKYKKSGEINAATDAAYPPFEFIDEASNFVGADIDLSEALSKVLGVTIKNNKAEFTSVMPGLASGRFDVAISSMGDFTSRHDKMDFIDYYQGGTSLLMKSTTPDTKDMLELCGSTVGVMKSTSSETFAKTNNEKCVSGGKSAVDIQSFPKHSDAILALTSGRVNFVIGDAATNGYSAKEIGPTLKNQVVDYYGGRWVAGIGLPKDSPLFQPMFDALVVVNKSGVYSEIMKKWGLENGAMEPAKNQGTDE